MFKELIVASIIGAALLFMIRRLLNASFWKKSSSSNFFPKALCFDLDGTLLMSNKTVSKATEKMLNDLHKQGAHIIIASGRAVNRIVMYSPSLPPSFHLVSYNGSVSAKYDSVSKQANIYHMTPLSGEAVKRLVKMIDADESLVVGLYENEIMHVRTQNEVNQMKAINIRAQLTKPFAPLAGRDSIVKCIFMLSQTNQMDTERKALAKQLQPLQLPELGVEILHTMADIELCPKGGKGEGLRHVCKYLGIDMKDVISFGDDGNDVSMLSATGFSVSPSNASLVAKKSAFHVSPFSNDEDFIVKEIERLYPITKSA